MMKQTGIIIWLAAALGACSDAGDMATPTPAAVEAESVEVATQEFQEPVFEYEAERFADIRILRYRIPGFENLPLQQKKLLYFLSQAGMSGRDIMWDQNYRYNLRIRRTIEEVIRHFPGDRQTEAFRQFMVYAKQMWFANGIHHHYSNDKFTPEFSEAYFAELVRASASDADYPLDEGQSVEALIAMLTPILFDPALDSKKVNLAAGVDKVTGSAVNFYRNVSEQEVNDFYADLIDRNDPNPVSYGLNSRLVKEDGELVEKVWKVGGLYSEAIEQVVYWLELALTVTETQAQHLALERLIQYYRSGDLADFDAYNIAWVEDTASTVDVINGFIEVYDDPLGYRGSFESVVSFRDEAETRRIATIAASAQWFEDNSPIMDEHKKAEVVGITGKAITVVSETGDSSPSTPVGINLPNSSWIRAQHGSKSVSLSNIDAAYNASDNGGMAEFIATSEANERIRTYGQLAGSLHTDMHEVIGHASGRLNSAVSTPAETLKQYASAMEEGRADLVALYYLMDPRLIEIGVMPSLEVGRAEYDNYITNGLMYQLRRIKSGDQIEESHMRNRQEIASWAYEHGLEDNVIEKVIDDGKTYFDINDYGRLRDLFGELLREHQRIKSEGDFAAAQFLIETYGTKVDEALHEEVLERFEALNVAPYSGMLNPKLVPVYAAGDSNGEILDILVEYPDNFTRQMLEYAEQYSFLPTVND